VALCGRVFGADLATVFFAIVGAGVGLGTGFCGAADVLKSDCNKRCPASTAQSSGVKPLGWNVNRRFDRLHHIRSVGDVK